jgi:hypothetical protein
MRRWELWVGEEGHSFFPEDNLQARAMATADGYTLSWETTARSHNEAARALYAHLDWGEYRPMLQDDGTPYPRDEYGEDAAD